MVFGVTPTVVAQYFAKSLRAINPKRIVIPFSGNFVLHQIAAKTLPSTPIIATDRSLYSRIIGFGLTKYKFDIKILPGYKTQFSMLTADNSPLGKAVQVIFFAEAAKAMAKSDIGFYERLVQDGKLRQEDHYKNILNRVKDLADLLKKMRFVDTVNFLDQCKKGDCVLLDTTYLNEETSKFLASLEQMFTPSPALGNLTNDFETILPELEKLTNKGVKVLWRTNTPVKDLPPLYELVLKHSYSYTGFYHVYTNAFNLEKHVGRYNPLVDEEVSYPIIQQSDIITTKSRIKIVPVSATVGNHYRLLWVKKANKTKGGKSLLVLVDDKLIGVLQLESGMNPYSHDNVIIFSDPVAPSSQYVRLSKLLVGICCTKYILKWMSEEYVWEHNGFMTRVYTDNDMSMKYRELFHLADKKETEDGGHYKNCLIYRNRDKIFPTFKSVLAWWIQKHSKYTF